MAPSVRSSISVSRRGSPSDEAGRPVVWVRGEQDIASRVALTAAIARAAQFHDAEVLVDMSGVTFMDASIAGALVGAANRLRARSQSLVLRRPSRAALQVLELCGLARFVQTASEPMLQAAGASAMSV